MLNVAGGILLAIGFVIAAGLVLGNWRFIVGILAVGFLIAAVAIQVSG